MSNSKAPSTAMTELLIAEYEARLERYRQLAGQQSELQQWALLFSGALWAWVLSRQQSWELVAASWIPFTMNIFFYRKTRLLEEIAESIYSRLNEIVREVGHDDPQYVNKWIPENWDSWSKWFWGAVLSLTMVMAMVYTALVFYATR